MIVFFIGMIVRVECLLVFIVMIVCVVVCEDSRRLVWLVKCLLISESGDLLGDNGIVKVVWFVMMDGRNFVWIFFLVIFEIYCVVDKVGMKVFGVRMCLRVW